MIEITHLATNTTMCYEVPTKEAARDALKNVRHRLYEEIAKLDSKIEELQA